MTAELFLVCGFAGYWFLKIWNRTRLDTIRAAGYHVVFKSILAGSALFIVAKGISLFLGGTGFQSLRLLHEVLFSIGRFLGTFLPQGERYADVIILTIALGFISPWLVNSVVLFFSRLMTWQWMKRLMKRIKEYLPAFYEGMRFIVRIIRENSIRRYLCTAVEGALQDAKKRGQITDVILIESCCHREKVVEILLQDYVSYIGFVGSYSMESSHTTDVNLVPLIKYHQPPGAVRSSQNIENLINEAQERLKRTEELEGLEDLAVVIQRSSIVHVRLLSEETLDSELNRINQG